MDIKYMYIQILILFFLLISNFTYAQVPVYLTYPEIIEKARQWQKYYPELIQVGFYGRTTHHNDILYIKLSGKKPQKTILITASIHSNEPLSTNVVLGYIGYLLYHNKEEQINSLIQSREIYFVPVVCPDHFPNQRYINNIDPNRNFDSDNTLSEIKYLKDFFFAIKPQAVISNHTFGRIYLIPYGNRKELCPNDSDYRKLVGQMAKLSNYKMIRCCQIYGHPIFGTEIDFYYKHKSFAIVQENGTHQVKPSWKDIEYEFKRTFPAFLLFLKEAPLVKIK